MPRRLLGFMMLLALGFGGCGDGGGETESEGGAPADATVELKATTFEPAEVAIKVGETVRWNWGSGVQHDVEGEGFKSKVQTKGQFDHTFEEAGTFAFKCNVHPKTMTGTVTVA